MLDLHLLRTQTDEVRKALAKRRGRHSIDRIIDLDQRYRTDLTELERLQKVKNDANLEVVNLRRAGQDAAKKIDEMKGVSDAIQELKKKVDGLFAELQNELLRLPNLPSEDTPEGEDAASNRLVREWGKIRSWDFKPKNHVELGSALGILDPERAAKISGASFIAFMGDGAALERALIQFMIDLHVREHGYKEVSLPFMVKRSSLEGTGQLPKFEEDLYRIYRGTSDAESGGPRPEDLFLIPTAEVPVTNLHREETLKEEELPIRYVSYSPCFRLEAGAYGKDTKGMIRVHQFDKVELVHLVHPDRSQEEHEKLLLHAEKIFKILNIPYRVMLLSGGDLGFSASKCYDIEIWAPGMGQWLEASSCSNFLEFQARRAGIKFKDSATKKNRWVHTLNGSGVALARTFVALIENYQEKDGSITIPAPLRPYMGNRASISSTH